MVLAGHGSTPQGHDTEQRRADERDARQREQALQARVRNHGTLSAGVGDVHIDANGWLSSAGRIEAARGGVHIQSAQAQTHTGSVLAAGNLNLHGGKQGARTAVENSGALRAGLEANIRASELSNAGQIDAQRLDVAVATLNNGGAIWQSGAQALAVNTATLNNTQGAAIGAVQASNAAPAPAPSPAPSLAPAPSPSSPAAAQVPVLVPAPLANGLISVTGTLNNSGAATLAGAGDLNLNTTEALNNAGNVRAQGVVARGQLLENSTGALQAATLDVHTTAMRLAM